MASFEDVSYALSCFLVTVTTKNSSTPGTGPVRLSFADDNLELPRSLTFATPHEGKTSNEEIPESLYCAAYLGKTRSDVTPSPCGLFQNNNKMVPVGDH